MSAPVQEYKADPYAQQQQQQPYPAQQAYQAPVQQQQQYAAQQPAVQYVQAAAQPLPFVTRGNGRGLIGKIPQFPLCCFCIDLWTGAMIIAFLTMVLDAWSGLTLLVASPLAAYNSSLGVILLIVGIIHLIIAVMAGYGFAGIYKRDPTWVRRFNRMYIGMSIGWALLEIINMAVVVSVYNSYFSDSIYYVAPAYPWASWVITFLIGSAVQFYFVSCLVSYERDLNARLGIEEGEDQGDKVQME